MPLDSAEKNQIAQGGLGASQLNLVATANLSTLGAAGLGIAFLPVALGVTTLFAPGGPFGPPGFPKGPTHEQLFGPVERLRARGLEPRISQNPFIPGSTVISTFDQGPILDQLVMEATLRRFTAGQDFSPILTGREALVRGLASTATARGFREKIPEPLRGGVFRETAESPLQFIEGDFLP